MVDSRTVNIFGALVLTLHDQIRQNTNRTVGMTGEAAAAVVVIGNLPRRSIEFLRKALLLSHSGTVRIIGKLVDKHFVRRDRQVGDERTSELTLTSKGERKAKAILGTRHKVIADALDTLSTEEQNQLRRITERLLAAVTKEDWADAMCRLCDESSCPLQTCPIAVELGCTDEP
jgi:MarR family transcriptional regulator, negative regulator of the multidrug operon emrRAB